MKYNSFSQPTKEPIVLALGYFDCVHLGHKKIFDKTISVARQKKCTATVFTFDKIVGKKSLYQLEERCQIYEYCGLKRAIVENYDKICNYSPKKFLQTLKKKFNIVAVVCGEDYRFGKKAKGDVELLKKQFENVFVMPIYSQKGTKISSTLIKSLVTEGNFEKANSLMVMNYYRKGVVVEGNKIGRKLGFRTCNLALDSSLFEIGEGVYKTKTIVFDKIYSSVSFIGKSETFCKENSTFETHIINFEDEIYDKEIIVVFVQKLRDNKKFDSAEELKEQLKKDIALC